MTKVPCRRTPGRCLFIEKLRAEIDVAVLIRLLVVSNNGYYDQPKRQPSARGIKDVELKDKIQNILTKNKGRYGSPRIFMALKNQGNCICKKRVELLYKELNLVASVMLATTRSVALRVKIYDLQEMNRLKRIMSGLQT